MKVRNYRNFKKGMGVMIAIPGDQHDGKQNKRPGIVINSNPEYLTVQLLSSRPSEYDFGSFEVNNKTQYLRTIYLKNVPLNQVRGVWKDWSRNKVVQLDIEGKIMNLIENNYHKVSSITLALNDYLNLKNKISILEKENKHYKKRENELLKFLPQELENELEK